MEIIESLLVVLVRSMGKVKPSDVHTSPEKLLHHRNGSGSRTESTHNLRFRPLLYHRRHRKLKTENREFKEEKQQTQARIADASEETEMERDLWREIWLGEQGN